MKTNVRVLLFAASLRKESLNERLIDLVATIVQKRGDEVDHARMADFDCRLYDDDALGIPDGAQRFRDRLLACDAFMISAPEYNASMSGVLKNLIDWTSRFRPQPFNGKQAFLVSASPSMAGGNRGLWSLRVPLEHLGARVYPDMFSLAQAHTAFGDDGRITNAMLQKRLENTIGCFLELVEAAKHYPAIKKDWVEFLGEKPDARIDREESNTLAR
jgi:NAD(P)H-dependent FMN reductase